MRFEHGDINLYYYHDTLTPKNIRAASYGTAHDSGTLVPEIGDVLNGFPGWTGSEYEAVTVRVVSVEQIGQGTTAYDVRVTTVTPAANPRIMRDEEWRRSPDRVRYVLLSHMYALAEDPSASSE